jgi:hypothetical protein
MAGSNMIELQKRWRAFSADRAKAKRAIQALDDADNAEIARLREGIIRRNAEFDEKWRNDKIVLQQKRDEAVMQEMSGPMGRPAQAILRELGSNNTVWIYELRARLQAIGALPEQSNVNTYNTPEERQRQQTQQQAAQLELAPTDEYAGVTWQHHNHQGVVGWLLSEDRTLSKKYGAPSTDFEGEWFIADREHNFLAGSEELFDATPKGEVTRKIKLLESLLDETYAGRIKEVDNPYTS